MAKPTQPKTAQRSPERFTPLQGQYLAFIHAYCKIHRRSPLEADLQHYFGISPPSVHRMVVTLAARGLLRRTPGQARSIELIIAPVDLPLLR